MNPVFQFIADTILFNAIFSTTQIIGIMLVISVYVVELIYNCFLANEQKKKHVEKTDDEFTKANEVK